MSPIVTHVDGFEITSWTNGSPVWCEFRVNGDKQFILQHSELKALEMCVARHREKLRAEIKHETTLKEIGS